MQKGKVFHRDQRSIFCPWNVVFQSNQGGSGAFRIYHQSAAARGRVLSGRLKLAYQKAVQNGVTRMKIYHCPGVHEWQTWRYGIFHFLQKIFRPTDRSASIV